ncbi:HVA22-like protein J [Striga asiatica]|uniref:HVA22-like protein n=1 Tax=Striga asiatica TaxID=4170 RepID=A0A5A7QDX7_STRAF|nr:HVA22-like protein J [Striga asiatica]
MIEDFISRSLILALGYAYPAFLCFKTIEKNRVAIQELRFWCQYWLPMYRGLKLGLFIYLWHPNTKGSEYVYETFLRPYLLKYEADIDRSLFEAKERALNLANYYWHDCTKLGSKFVVQFFQFLVSQSSSIKLPVGSQLHNAQEQQSSAVPPLLSSKPSRMLKRSISDKPPVPLVGPTASHLSQTPKSESMKVRLHSQTKFIHAEDGGPGGQPGDDADKIKSH